jgi:hypothetical protein
VWDGWQGAVALLGLEGLKPLVKVAFARKSIDPMDMKFEDFEEDLQWALDHPGAPHRNFESEYSFWNDSIGELSRWYGFSEKYFADKERWAADQERWASEPEDLFDPPWRESAVNVYRNVGRNDPCPCGSGKKYKKCCLKLTVP